MTMKKGSSRYVLLTKNYAIKIPYLGIWRNFLWGLIASMNEVSFSSTNDPKLSEVIFSIPFGFLVIMKRAEPMDVSEFNKDLLIKFCENGSFVIPAEIKADSFGYINNKLVAIDYG